MMNVQLNDILDVALNIPNALCTFYFQSRACNIKYKKIYVAVFFLVISLLTFLQDIECISQEFHVVVACITIVLGTQIFVVEKRLAALQFCVLLYLSLVLCEALSYVVCFILFGESILVMINEIRSMIYIKLYFAIASFSVEYAVYRLWMGRADKLKDNPNNGIFIILPLELVIAWCSLWISLTEPENSNAAVVLVASIIFALIFNIMQLVISEQDIRKQKEFVRAEILKSQMYNQDSRKKELKKELEKANETKRYILENVGRAAVFLEEKQGENAREQLQGIVDTIAVKYMYSNNKIADALLSQKAKICDEYGIQLSCRLDFPDNMPVDNARLCIVLSNLLDNAIRACRELKPDTGKEYKPFISLNVNEQFGYLVIRQENSFNGIVENRRSGAFSEHGLGMEIIKNIADELKGELVTEHDDKVFVTSVGVPLM